MKYNRVVFEKKDNDNFRNTNSWHVAQWLSHYMSDAPSPSANLKVFTNIQFTFSLQLIYKIQKQSFSDF